MSEAGEIFRHIKNINKAQRAQKKEDNYEYSKKLLVRSTFPFKEYDNGHFAVTSNSGVVYDFWATTGLFINRKTKYRGRGIKDLLKCLNI